MTRLQDRGHIQIGGACTARERDELDQELLNLKPQHAVTKLNALRVDRLGTFEYTLAIGRFYRHMLYMEEHGFPPDTRNVFWQHILQEADELKLSAVEHMKRAMGHVDDSGPNSSYQIAEFEIKFMQKPAIWWRKLYELTSTLDYQVLEAPIRLGELKKILSDTALDNLANPEMVEELDTDHLIFAKEKVLKTFAEKQRVSFASPGAYRQQGFEIGRNGWIQRIYTHNQRTRGGRAENQEDNQTDTSQNGGRRARKGRRRPRYTPY